MTQSKLTTSRELSYYNGISREGAKPGCLFVHHTTEFSARRAIDFMKNKNSRSSCSTYFLGDGQLVNLIDEDYKPSSTGSYNATSISVELLNLSGEPNWPVRDSDLEILAQLYADLSTRYGWGPAVIGSTLRYHKEVANTRCPGEYVISKLPAIAARANEILGQKQEESPMGRKLKNHSSAYWLREDAAAAFDRMEDAKGFINLNSAGRTVAEQQALINRWNRGGAANRPPYLYQPASPAATSNHVRGGGLAFDTSDWRRVAQFAGQFGFSHPYPNSDPVHFEYVGGGSGGGGGQVSQDVKNQQAWLNQSRSAGLAVDGIRGPATIQAFKNYQTFLRGYGYTGAIDGIWGGGTQSAHQKYYDAWHTPKPAGLAVDGLLGPATIKAIQARVGTAQDGQFGPATKKALQSRLGVTADGIFGPNSIRALQRKVGAGVDGAWGNGTTRALQTYLNNGGGF